MRSLGAFGSGVGGQSLRRGQMGNQGAAKAFGAVKMVRERPKPSALSKWVKMAQNGSKWLKIGPKWLEMAENGGQ